MTSPVRTALVIIFALVLAGAVWWLVSGDDDGRRLGRGGQTGLPYLPPRASADGASRHVAADDVATPDATVSVVGTPTAAADEFIVVNDEQRRYQIRLPARQWSIIDQTSGARRYHPAAELAVVGPDGCYGVLILTARKVDKYAELQPLARERLSGLPVEAPQTLWFEPTRYNDRPGYRFSARGVSKADATQTLRVQYSVVERDGWVFEVIATSTRLFTTARWCHDRVTAAMSF